MNDSITTRPIARRNHLSNGHKLRVKGVDKTKATSSSRSTQKSFKNAIAYCTPLPVSRCVMAEDTRRGIYRFVRVSIQALVRHRDSRSQAKLGANGFMKSGRAPFAHGSQQSA